jgi:hypothetical protein
MQTVASTAQANGHYASSASITAGWQVQKLPGTQCKFRPGKKQVIGANSYTVQLSDHNGTG